VSNVSGTAGAVSWNLNDDEEDNKEDGKAGQGHARQEYDRF
jgi:hypothetical protein